MTSSEHRVDRVRTVFDDWARRGRAEGMAESHTPFARPAFEALDLRPDGWFVDIGCGNGYAVRWAAAAAPAGRAVGLDVSPEMIDRARDRSAGYDHVAFHVARFPQHDLPRDRFDAVFSMEVLYYLPDLDLALAEIVRLLRPGGRCACAVDFYGENVASHGWPDDVGVEMTLLSSSEWAARFAAAGFSTVVQRRIRVPPDRASEPWKATEGSLLTIGRK